MPADYSKNIVYLSKTQYQELLTNQTITVNGTTVTYNENDIYVTPQEEPYIKPSNGIPASDLASGVIPAVPVTDVQIDGGSILNNGIANIPKAESDVLGVIKPAGMGINVNGSGQIYIAKASNNHLKAGTSNYAPIVPANQDSSAFYGLAKAAGADMASLSSVTVGQYPEAQKVAINNMLGSVSKDSLDNAGITGRTYTEKFGGEFTVTTATASGYISPYVRASVTGRISKHYMHRVIVNGTEYILRTRLWYEKNVSSPLKVYEYLGNLNLFISDTSGVPGGTDNVPFLIISDLNNNNSIDIFTQTSGTYIIKVEQINNTQKSLPKSLIYEDAYVPIEKNNNGGTYNGVSIGVNELKNQRGTLAFGYGNIIENEFATAIGSSNQISGWGSVALSTNSVISGAYSVALGSGNNISGLSSVALNVNNTVTGNYSAAFGAEQNVSGYYATALGYSNIVNHAGQLAFGVFNIPDPSTASNSLPGNYIEIVGNGQNPNNRSNARTLDWNGNQRLKGLLYVNCNADSSGGTLVPYDVQVNGTSVVTNGVANIPVASTSNVGVVGINNNGGIVKDSTNNKLLIAKASSAMLCAGTNVYFPIVPYNQHESAFYGLAKAAGADMASSSNAVGTYTDAAKVAIRTMLGATSSNVIAVQDEQPTDSDTKVWLPETEATGIQVPTMEDMANYVQKTDYATTTSYGLLKIGTSSSGLQLDPSGYLKTYCALSADVKSGTDYYKPIVPQYEHMAVFYGLAKAAGDTTQAASDNAVGTYTDGAKSAIQTMLGVPGDVQVNGTSVVSNGVANIPLATSVDSYGLVRCKSDYGINIGSTGYPFISGASNAQIKEGTNTYKPIIVAKVDVATFYGLAKAAGDTTMSSSSNAIGTYTTEAKAAIHTMLGIDPASIAAQVDIPLVETVSGTTPTITGQPNVRYVCGEVSTISITPPASGSVDVIFESGSTATTMTVPSTVKWPAWFDAEALEADTTYEILITDGIYGSVMTWAT